VVLDILGLIVVGLIIGALARLLLPGRQKIGIGLTLLLGVLGALIGGAVAGALGTGDVFELNVIGFIAAVLASVGLLAVGEAAGIGGTRGRRGLDRPGDRRMGP
jgi:uncharacterized membrane protein YeaQ/YmgE (transglycosylase-associated protein family)